MLPYPTLANGTGTGIKMCIHLACIITNDNDSIFVQVTNKVITWFWYLYSTTGKQQNFFKNRYPLKIKNGDSGIRRLLQAIAGLVIF